ncbi:MAG: DUF4493 domain-containing protein [Alistipes sp.]|nr:DUF4493 domain-containing protein [Alistipes sp.]
MRKFLSVASLFALVLSACSNEASLGDEKGKGRVTINCVAETTVDDFTRANVSCTTPATEDFALTIDGVSHTYTSSYASVTEFNESDIHLHYGSYKATVVAGNVTEEGYDKAAFVGVANFDIAARENTEVMISAKIANTLVKVEVTDAFKAYFVGGHTLTLATAAGNEFDVTAQSQPLFIAPATFTINGTATKQPNQSGAEGTVVTLPEYKLEKPAAQTFYTVKFDVESAGSTNLTITLNDILIESIEIEQELNDNAQ